MIRFWKKTAKRKDTEAGNMVLLLFATIGMVAALGAGTAVFIRGPVSGMAKINKTTLAESQVLVATKMIMLDVANLSSADCDSDKLSEARPWRDAAGAGPDGVAGSDGGGYLPQAIGMSKLDPWGTEYGYCVWDHGSQIDAAGCGGASQNRLQGTNLIEYPVVAVISAGKNKTFETPCLDFGTADANGDGDLLDAGDSDLITRGGDDIVKIYSYAEASQENPGLWSFEIEGGEAVAVMDTGMSSVEFTGSEAAFGGNFELTGTEGLDIPDDTELATCDASTEGQVRRNMSGSSVTLEICESSSWNELSTSGSGSEGVERNSFANGFDPEGANCTRNNGGPFVLEATYATSMSAQDVWGDGTYIYVADNTNGLKAFTFDGSSFTAAGTAYTAANHATAVWGDGTYIYVADGSNGVRSLTFDGSSFTLVDTDTTPAGAVDVWGDGTYIYVADGGNGIIGFTMSGGSFSSHVTQSTTSANAVWGDGTYIYVADDTGGLKAYTFNGSSFVSKGSYTTSMDATDVWGDGAYIYVADTGNGLKVFTFDGSSFSLLDSQDDGGTYQSVWGDGVYVYAAADTTAVYAYEFNGDSFSLVGTYNTSVDASGVWGDGTYVYVADTGNGIKALSGFECTSTYPMDAYVSQATVTQSAASGDNLGSVAWMTTLASDTNSNEAGIAFTVDQSASRKSIPSAAITAIREADPGTAGLAFKTRSSSNLNVAAYLGYNGYFGIGVDGGDTSKLYSAFQIGDHYGASWDSDYAKGLLITQDDAATTNQLGYFGFSGDDDASGIMLFSKDLKIQKSDVNAATVTEYLRFDSSLNTSFYGNAGMRADGSTVRLRHRSYSNTAANGGVIDFERYRGSSGSETIVNDGDAVGSIKFRGYDGSVMPYDSQAVIQAKVNGTPAAGDVPVDIIIGLVDSGTASGSEKMRITSAGDVGIGVSSPEAMLHVGGRIVAEEGVTVGNDTNCSTATDANTLRYTGTAFEMCDGSSWNAVSSGSSSTAYDCSPIGFDFLGVSDVSTSTSYSTNTILVGGLDEACILTVASDSTSVTVNKNGTDETANDKIVTVENGDRIYLKITSSASASTTVTTYVSIGDKTDKIEVTTN